MATLIAYASKYGCTKKCAGILWGKMEDRTDLLNVKKEKKVDLSQYDKVIISGSIYAGKIQKEVTRFCEKHLDELLQKKVGLFICCMENGDEAENELKHSFPELLLEHAIISEFFGGELTVSEMNLFDKFVIKMIARDGDKIPAEDTSTVSNEKISTFANRMNTA
ncbi:flavodoxin domain-containing protein [Mesobacillus zeae]|nr:flavodoxin domain-containing protein [Mesobacillus zeae]